MSLIYYIPGVRAVQRDQVRAAGLGHAFPEGVSLGQVHANGPDGGDGCVIGSEAKGLGYFPARQKWQASSDGRFWIGREGVIAPADLERGEMLDGHLVKLQDGQEWLVPVARSFARGSSLPEALVLGPGGELVTEPLPEYAEVSAAAEKIAEAIFAPLCGEDGPELTVGEVTEIAAAALSLNYRVGMTEVGILGLFTTHNVMRVAEAFVDLPTMIEVGKAQVEAGKVEGPAGTPGGSSLGDGGSA